MRPLRRDVPAPAGLGSEFAEVPDGASLTLDLRLESVTEGVLVSGTVTAPVVSECGRCLDPVSGELVLELVELFAYPNSVTDETAAVDEVHRLEGDLLDLEPVVHDIVVIGLPMTMLCRPDCAGLCPSCGQRLDDLPADHGHETLDPRWAALQQYATGGSDDS
jgi:uncharacterized protein